MGRIERSVATLDRSCCPCIELSLVLPIAVTFFQHRTDQLLSKCAKAYSLSRQCRPSTKTSVGISLLHADHSIVTGTRHS